MIPALNLIKDVVRRRWARLLLWGLAFAIGFQIAMLFALVIRFGEWPNYVIFYDWPGAVWTIVASTPSWSDIPPIVAEEWLIEVGRMNYDYGTGISVWSLNVMPSRLLVLFGLGALIGLSLQLSSPSVCAAGGGAADGSKAPGASAAAGFGASLVALTNVTMSWVVCCATPNWVVGLAMMGLGVSTSLAVDPYGSTIALSGFGLLLLSILYLAWRRTRRVPSGARSAALAAH